jgi:hypothetical protein
MYELQRGTNVFFMSYLILLYGAYLVLVIY